MTGLLATGVISQFANASGMLFYSASQLFVWAGDRYIGWSNSGTVLVIASA